MEKALAKKTKNIFLTDFIKRILPVEKIKPEVDWDFPLQKNFYWLMEKILALKAKKKRELHLHFR